MYRANYLGEGYVVVVVGRETGRGKGSYLRLTDEWRGLLYGRRRDQTNPSNARRVIWVCLVACYRRREEDPRKNRES